MKKIIKIVIGLAAVLAGVSCSKDHVDISGEWRLKSAGEMVTEDVDVYMSFSDSHFEIFQRVGGNRYWYYDGTYSVYENIFQGTYSDGSKLGGYYYTVTVNGDELTMVSHGRVEETSVYVRERIPEEVRLGAVPPVKSVKAGPDGLSSGMDTGVQTPVL